MIKITADSTCDLSLELTKELNIKIIPVHIVIDDMVYSDNIDIFPKDIFQYVEHDKKVCKTAAINVYEYENVFKSLQGTCDAIIHIALGSSFSSCYQNAMTASQEFSNVYVIDSANLSTGSGYLVYKVSEMINNGMKPNEICEKIKEYIPEVDVSFIIDKLDYLYNGGRCSGIELVGTKLLRIKPCIEVISGEMKVGKKYRGSFEYDVMNYLKDRFNDQKNSDKSLLFITYTTCNNELIETIKNVITSNYDFKKIIVTTAGCTISAHCGENTLGLIFKRTNSKS